MDMEHGHVLGVVHVRCMCIRVCALCIRACGMCIRCACACHVHVYKHAHGKVDRMGLIVR